MSLVEVGREFTIHRYRQDRVATVLAVIEGIALCQYAWKKDTDIAFALVDADVIGNALRHDEAVTGGRRGMSYKIIPKKWFYAMLGARTKWHESLPDMNKWFKEKTGKHYRKIDNQVSTNPFDEVFDTKGTIKYLNQSGYSISKIAIHKYLTIGYNFGVHTRIYFRRELDNFRQMKPYDRDDPDNLAYEQAIMSQLLTTEQAATYIDYSVNSLRRVMTQDKVEHRILGHTAFFLKEWLDDFKANYQTTPGRPKTRYDS